MIDDYVYLKQYTADDSIYNDIICYLKKIQVYFQNYIQL